MRKTGNVFQVGSFAFFCWAVWLDVVSSANINTVMSRNQGNLKSFEINEERCSARSFSCSYCVASDDIPCLWCEATGSCHYFRSSACPQSLTDVCCSNYYNCESCVNDNEVCDWCDDTNSCVYFASNSCTHTDDGLPAWAWVIIAVGIGLLLLSIVSVMSVKYFGGEEEAKEACALCIVLVYVFKFLTVLVQLVQACAPV
ncbi:uncharacterized protein LOC143469405 isoform X1 [Clavelina lepadiformis]|uniref:uncharacterized protein LOC143469405 isoform X1 n=1 Tax=Clavelina lepadiformis TaxID=159417 RepID=UPI0040431327